MLERIFHPEIFHGNTKKQPYFEGWYFKHVSSDLSTFLIVIPGVLFTRDDTHAFIQIITGKPFRSYYCRYDINSFNCPEKVFNVTIDNNHFSLDGITLDIEQDEFRLQADIEYSAIQQLPKTLFSPSIMGFFGYLPFLQCNHGLLSLNHKLHGHMTLNDTTHRFDEGKGYMEKDQFVLS